MPSITAMLLIGMAFMIMFFAIMPIAMGYIEGAIAMFVVGAIMVLAGVYVHRTDKKPVEPKKVEEKVVKVKIKCRYCGRLNEPDEEKCGSCGATL